MVGQGRDRMIVGTDGGRPVDGSAGRQSPSQRVGTVPWSGVFERQVTDDRLADLLAHRMSGTLRCLETDLLSAR